MSTMCRSKGFTLIELLLAMALLVILSAALYGSFFAIMRGREIATEGAEGRRELRASLDLIRRELSSVIYKSNDKLLRFVVEDRDAFGKPASTLTMTVISPPAVQLPCSDLQEVIYRVEEREGKLVLTRSGRDIFMTGKPLAYPQMDELEGFLVECEGVGNTWVKTWDTSVTPRVPKNVRVTFTVREGDKKRAYSTVVKLGVTPP